MVKIFTREVFCPAGDNDIAITDEDTTLIISKDEDVFITKLNSSGKTEWILSKELAQKLKEAL